MWAFVFAPPGTGKSTYVNELPVNWHNQWVEDADDIIAATIGWPRGCWWEDDKKSFSFCSHAVKALLEYMKDAEYENRDLVILLSGFPFFDEYIIESGYDIYNVVLPYTENVVRLKAREKLDQTRPKVKLSDLAVVRERIRSYGKRADSIEQLVAELDFNRYYMNRSSGEYEYHHV